MKTNWNKFNRQTHYWGSIVCAVPVLIIIATGSLLLLKNDFNWIQPATIRGIEKTPNVSFDDILKIAMTVEQAAINGWEDIDRIDVRPGKGVVKVRAESQWEVQIDHNTLEILQVAYRRSDFIESIHDGTFFHKKAKLFLFFPASLILLALWVTGLYLFIKTLLIKSAKKKRQKEAMNAR